MYSALLTAKCRIYLQNRRERKLKEIETKEGGEKKSGGNSLCREICCICSNKASQKGLQLPRLVWSSSRFNSLTPVITGLMFPVLFLFFSSPFHRPQSPRWTGRSSWRRTASSRRCSPTRTSRRTSSAACEPWPRCSPRPRSVPPDRMVVTTGEGTTTTTATTTATTTLPPE